MQCAGKKRALSRREMLSQFVVEDANRLVRVAPDRDAVAQSAQLQSDVRHQVRFAGARRARAGPRIRFAAADVLESAFDGVGLLFVEVWRFVFLAVLFVNEFRGARHEGVSRGYEDILH
jgi:hypothetical protein